MNILNIYAWLVGILWGSTNPLIKQGSILASAKSSGPTGSQGNLEPWVNHLTTPSFIIPQLINQSGSALFIYLLGISDISVVVPIANAISVLFNALADLALGERYRLSCLLPGLALVFGGVLLCGLEQSS